MRSTTTGSAMPIRPATTMAVPIARAVSSRPVFPAGAAPAALRPWTGWSTRASGEGESSAEARSCTGSVAMVSLLLAEDPGEDAVQLGEAAVADLQGAAAAFVLELDFRPQLALQLLHQVTGL